MTQGGRSASREIDLQLAPPVYAEIGMFSSISQIASDHCCQLGSSRSAHLKVVLEVGYSAATAPGADVGPGLKA